jgi:crossover junction endodeoxyribonuclease RuvC
MTAPLRLLGVDPGLNRCGWGIILADGPRLSYVAHGVITPNPKASLAIRLATIHAELIAVAEAHAPDAAAIEETYVNNNPRAALALGQARGAAMVALAQAGLSIGEYPPATIKKSLVGSGQADKTQIAFMVQRLLPTAGKVNADAADALAVALCDAAHGGYKRRMSAS